MFLLQHIATTDHSATNQDDPLLRRTAWPYNKKGYKNGNQAMKMLE